VLGVVFSIPSEKIGLGKRLRNDLFCVEWDVKPQFSQSVQQNGAVIVQSCIFSVLVRCCIGANLEGCRGEWMVCECRPEPATVDLQCIV